MSFQFYPSERVALFIDGPNMYRTTKALGFEIDYKQLLSYFRSNCILLRALYYTPIFEDVENKSIRPLIDWLEYNGYSTVIKPAKEYADSQGYRKFKCNIGIEICVDAFRLVDHVDHIVIFSGDADFRALIAALQTKKTRVSVVSTLLTQPVMVADALRRQADQFIELAELEELIRVAPGKSSVNKNQDKQTSL